MYKFLTLRNQLIVASVLFAAILTQHFFLKSANSASFDAKPFHLNIEKVDKISVTDSQKEITLEKGLTEWVVKLPSGQSANADANAIDALLSQMEQLTFNYVADTGSDKFSGYELTDSAATQLRVWQEGKPVAHLYIGKFDYNPQTSQLTTHVRVGEAESIYAVNDFLRMTINTDQATYRNKQLIKAEQTAINQIDIEGNNQSVTLTKHENGWLMGEQETDPKVMKNYLEKISNLSSRYFLSTLPPDTQKYGSLKIVENGQLNAELTFYEQNGVVVAVQSSINRGTVFDATQLELDKILPNRTFFLPKENQ